METLLEKEIIKPMPQKTSTFWANDDVLVIILLYKNFNFTTTFTPYDIDICGKKMWEWVALSVGECEIKTTVATKESDILSLIKPYLNNKRYTMVLYSDTPLFSSATFMDIMNYVRARGVNALKLPRGFVFDTNYLRTITSLLSDNVVNFGNEHDFFEVDTPQKLYEVRQITKQRILDFHISNGVSILDKNSTQIDADVVISSGAVIGQNNVISGLTYIGKNCKIEPNNIIHDSVISDNCVIKCSYIDQSRISENMIVGPFESIVGKSN